jgi:hypothetical protein
MIFFTKLKITIDSLFAINTKLQSMPKAKASGDDSIAYGNAIVTGRGSIAIGPTDAKGNVILNGPTHITTPGGTTIKVS